MMRIRDWLIKAWRKILIFISAGVLFCALAVVPCFADSASYASGQPFVSGEYFLNVTCNPSTDNIKYQWRNNDTSTGSGTYAYQSVSYLNSSLPLMAGDYWIFKHTFSDNNGYMIDGTITLPYRNLPYRDDTISYYLKFAMGFSTMSNLGNGWLNATLRFYNSSDVRLGEVYTMTKITQIASFAIQTQVPAFSDPVAYMTLQFSGVGSSDYKLYIDTVSFSSLVWTLYCDSVVTVDYSDIQDYLPNPTPAPDFNDAVDYITNVQDAQSSVDAQIQSIIADAASIDTGIDNASLVLITPALSAFKFQFNNWWTRCDPVLRKLIFFFVGTACLTSLAGLTVSIINKSKGG